SPSRAAPRRRLHSFPTRRSSDLAPAGRFHGGPMTLLFVLAAILVLVGLAGIVLPALPGIPLIFAGLLLAAFAGGFDQVGAGTLRSEEHTSELQSRENLVCRLLLE